MPTNRHSGVNADFVPEGASEEDFEVTKAPGEDFQPEDADEAPAEVRDNSVSEDAADEVPNDYESDAEPAEVRDHVVEPFVTVETRDPENPRVDDSADDETADVAAAEDDPDDPADDAEPGEGVPGLPEEEK